MCSIFVLGEDRSATGEVGDGFKYGGEQFVGEWRAAGVVVVILSRH